MKNKIKLLIIGKNSFLASYIFFLNKKIYIKKIKYSKFVKQSKESLSKFDYILNCSLNKKYFLQKYNKKYDFDYYIINKIKNLNINYIFLSTRKVYKPKFNICEENITKPYDNYAKNKVITENYIKNNLPNNYLILRISNIIGIRLVKNNRSHNLFLDNFIMNLKNNFLLNHGSVFKDFISVEQFVYIFFKIIKKNLKGVFNISLGKKIYVSEILKWLTVGSQQPFVSKNFYNKRDYNTDSFTLNNHKIKKALNISIKKTDLKIYCLKISRKIFAKLN
jgi:nucleoside-diphosphate-sugar epimerase